MNINPTYIRLVQALSMCLFLSQPSKTFAQITEEAYEQRLTDINARYQSIYDDGEREGNDIQKEMKTCLIEGSVDADWELTKIVFDIPEVLFRNKEMSFHTVKTTFTNKVIAKLKVPNVLRGP
jgi:hypothetical protein